ncbi:unnamed protein product [Acanthoscelides obtectus]|uniref:Uncharacterized protein n=1 Tax=Acanthoscelides obtectus TaxID=200917 RepID=A0A9P0K0D2_ACAOB|nr:unnamed protein product [Acanthoscelides obtectus]CAK1648671.1 hypothetical protein AOBTE_LOCUS15817 [Acanthoscelides obtectus]
MPKHKKRRRSRSNSGDRSREKRLKRQLAAMERRLSEIERSRSRGSSRPPSSIRSALTLSPPRQPPVPGTDACSIASSSELSEIFENIPVNIEEHSKENTPPQGEQLEEDILNILGKNTIKQPDVGPAIHNDLAVRWAHNIQMGLEEEEKNRLLEKYLPPENCTQVKAPTLNLEVKAAISSSVQKRDERLSALQRQIGASLSCIGSALTLILKEEGGGNRTYIQLLNDASKLLTDLHRTESIARRELVALNLNSDVKQILSEATVDGLLFGTDLEARLKSSKDLEKSGRELKAVKAKPLQNAAKPLNYQSLPRYQQGARRGGHQHQRPSYSTNRYKPRREPPRRLNQGSQNSYKLKTRNPRQ